MRRNSGWACLPGHVVDELVSTVTGRLAARHPSVGAAVVDAVVQQAAGELVSTVADVELFGRLLDRRADARLAAMTGAPIPVARRSAAPSVRTGTSPLTAGAAPRHP
jgi:hypothetical protein